MNHDCCEICQGLTSGYCKSILVANRVELITKDVKGNSELQPKDIEHIKEVQTIFHPCWLLDRLITKSDRDS